jgi:hypothetical protein
MEQESDRQESTEQARRTWVEQIEVAGGQLIDRVKELAQEGNTKRVIIRTQDGRELMAVPLTVGVVAGGILTFGAPLLAALGALAALVSRVKLDVIREEPDAPTTASQEDKPLE